MLKLVQWGAGNIGRSFIGQIFAVNGCTVTFVDINDALVSALKAAGRYRVVTLSGQGESVIEVGGITAIRSADGDAVTDAVCEADWLSFSIGRNNLERMALRLAGLILARHSRKPSVPLDIIIAENVRNGAGLLRSLLLPHLPADFPFDSYVGLVETSLGKMVPIQTSDDYLTVFAEPFNTLIVDRDGFRGTLPAFPQIKAVSPIAAWVDEKLYIHNLGHAAAAYLGNRAEPRATFIWECLENARVERAVRNAMEQGAGILQAEYPGVFTGEELRGHIDDLLSRFANRALGDTVFRVGRDLERKLRFDDRLLGAILLAEKHRLPWDEIGRAYSAAFSFDPPGGNSPADASFRAKLESANAGERILLAAGEITDPDRKNLLLRALDGFPGPAAAS